MLRHEQQKRPLGATALGWLILPIWVAACWAVYALVRYLFGVDLTTEMVFHAFTTALASPFVAIAIAWDATVSAFRGLPLIGQIILVVMVALGVIALIVENAVRRIRGDQ
jgi:ABC-type amino acid transport system permease subunit